MGRFSIKFQYSDSYSNGKWNDQECTLYAYSEYDAQKKCKELYGLGIDCDYRIISVKKV